MQMTESKNSGSISYLIGVCLVAALGGLLFGYDTGVVNGSLQFVNLKFDVINTTMKGFIASSALIACIFGAGFAGTLSDYLGRKKVLILSAVLFLISAIGTAFPQNIWQFIVFRFIGGLGVGAASMTSPMYIAEISPARIRGRMVSVNQFAIVTGMLVVYFVNYLVGAHGVNLNNDDVTALLEKTKLSISNDRKNEVSVVKDAMSRQLLSQIANYKVKVDPETVEAISSELEKQLTDQGLLIGKSIPDALSGYVEKADDWECLEIADKAAEELVKYGVKLDVKSDEAFVMDIAGQLARQIADEKIETEKLAISIMTHNIVTDSAKEDIALDRTIVEDLADKLVVDVESLSIEAWNVVRGWRWMFGSESLPAAFLLILTLIIPESPRWLTKKGRKDEAMAILAHVDGSEYAREEMVSIEETISHESGSLKQLFHPGMKLVLVIGVALAVLQQVTGINVFLYFGSDIFGKLGGETIDAALLQQIVVGATNLIFTIIAICVVDKLGRKPLMIVGSAGMGISLFAMGMAGVYQAKGLWLLAFVLAYIACFAISVGPVVWVILSEIFPTKIRGRAMGIATICLWTANTVVTQTYPMMAENKFLIKVFHNGFPFFVYGSMCIVLIVFMWRYVPETKGKSLEEIEKMWFGSDRRKSTIAN